MSLRLEIRRGPVDLETMVPAMRAVFQAAFRRFLARAEALAHRNATTLLHRRTGALDRGIGSRVTVRGLVMEGALTQRETHGVAQELGADIPPRLVRPTRPDGVLHWVDATSGGDVFARMSRPGAFHLPARPYLQPALLEAAPEFEAELAGGVARLARGR